jgi:AcrR family transcriptional regulator
MRSIPKTVQRPRSELDIPAKERIAEKTLIVFTEFGLGGTVQLIAELAHTNVATVLKYYRSKERMALDFLKSLMRQVEQSWQERELEYPNDPEAQLRQWIYFAQITSDIRDQSPYVQLSRASVDLLSVHKHPHLAEIEVFWQTERRRIAKLCEAAKFRDPSALADKLVLLTQGAHNERNCYGDRGPSCRLAEAGDDLMVAHGAQRKQPYNFD